MYLQKASDRITYVHLNSLNSKFLREPKAQPKQGLKHML